MPKLGCSTGGCKLNVDTFFYSHRNSRAGLFEVVPPMLRLAPSTEVFVHKYVWAVPYNEAETVAPSVTSACLAAANSSMGLSNFPYTGMIGPKATLPLIAPLVCPVNTVGIIASTGSAPPFTGF